MANRTWQIDIADQKHIIEVKMGSFAGGGTLTVDGKVIDKWGTSIAGLPPQIKFEINGKKAEIKGGGFMANVPMLYLDGKEIK